MNWPTNSIGNDMKLNIGEAPPKEPEIRLFLEHCPGGVVAVRADTGKTQWYLAVFECRNGKLAMLRSQNIADPLIATEGSDQRIKLVE